MSRKKQFSSLRLYCLLLSGATHPRQTIASPSWREVFLFLSHIFLKGKLVPMPKILAFTSHIVECISVSSCCCVDTPHGSWSLDSILVHIFSCCVNTPIIHISSCCEKTPNSSGSLDSRRIGSDGCVGLIFSI